MPFEDRLPRLVRECWALLYPESDVVPVAPTAYELASDLLKQYQWSAGEYRPPSDMVAAMSEYSVRLRAILPIDTPTDPGNLPRLRPRQEGGEDARASKGINALHSAIVGIEVTDNEAAEIIQTSESLIVDGFDAVDSLYWIHGEPGAHPLAPFISAWLARVEAVSLADRETGIIPTPYANVRELQSVGSGWLPGFDSVTNPVGETLPLPGLDRLLRPDTATALVLWDALDVNRPGADRGAAVALRLFVNLLVSLPAPPGNKLARIEGTHHLRLTLRDLVENLWPNGWKRSRDMERLRRAMFQLDRALVPFGNGGYKRVVSSGELVIPPPDYPLDGPLSFTIYLPYGSGRGPLVHRPTLNQLGVQSRLKYRAELGLAHRWDRAAHNGSYPYATRPEVQRNAEGLIIDQNGRVVTERMGRREVGVKNWAHPRAVKTGRRERNPAIKYLGAIREQEILDLCYPRAHITPRTKAVYLKRAWNAIMEMADAGLLEIVDGSNGGVYIAPPMGYGPNWSPPSNAEVAGP